MKLERLKLFIVSIIYATAVGLLCRGYVIVADAHADGTIGNAFAEICSTVKHIYNCIEFN